MSETPRIASVIVKERKRSRRTLRRHDAIHEHLKPRTRSERKHSRRATSPDEMSRNERPVPPGNMLFDIRQMILETDGERRRHLMNLQGLYTAHSDSQSSFTSFAFLMRLSAIHHLYFPEESGDAIAKKIEAHRCRKKKLSTEELRILNMFELCKITRCMVTEASCLLFDRACDEFVEYRHRKQYDSFYR